MYVDLTYYDETGKTLRTEECIIYLTINEEKIEDRVVAICLPPNDDGSINSVVTFPLPVIFDLILEKLNMQKK